ncbi:MAG: DMT family transporter [Rhodobacteraceae bacterium]|nr:DMT family transporter [Paracoccaceae bacterium]
MNDRMFLLVSLLLIGVFWGITVPLTKIAVSTGHQPFGLIFWQLVIVVVVLVLFARLRRRSIVFAWKYMRPFVMVALCGAVLPDVFFYAAAAKLPAGVLSIILASVPLFSLPIAIGLGLDQFAWARLLGLVLGLMGILLLIGPDAISLDGSALLFVPLALLAPLFYATEGNLVALWGTQGLDPVQTLLGASIIGVVLTLPIALASGQWIDPFAVFGPAEAALVAGAIVHALVYAGYVWLIGRAGSVFAAQSSYLVNGFGVFWAIVLLGESYSTWVWTALLLLFLGVFLVQPRARELPVEDSGKVN